MSQIPEGAVTESADGCLISCFATPRASRNALVAWHDNRLKIALAAPPVDGEANKALVKFIAEVLKQPKGNVAVVSGLTGRRKVVAVKAMSADAVKAVLSAAVKD